MTKSFQAVLAEKHGDDVSVKVTTMTDEDLPPDGVLIKTAFSGINYKDGLAGKAGGNVVREYPLILGIDAAGTVVSSNDSRFQEGDEVIATSYELGVSRHGGLSEYVSVPGDWLVSLPKHLSQKEAMVYGTAGFTAALSVHRLEENGLSPEKGSVLVTGATGGVGGIAISILSQRGYHVVASTGNQAAADYLKQLGANEVISREDVYDGKLKALSKQQWQGAVDPVGGKQLASLLSKIQYGGSVAVSGLTGGGEVPATVFPFILRGVNLLGIDSVYCPMETRKAVWQRMAGDLKPDHLLNIVDKEISLQEVPDALNDILENKIQGRVIVEL
ncbi:acryloyl-CoA reductase [Bacillus atrophaeus]|uniref:acrylyl-CoA reductase family protein n=1 Tax=Bacillus atrophaeus TaxID=1452 RepID=UPI000D04235D|nr:acryloyl-CoA reductase [Bacillus atrophaeus]MCY8486684.1 acryloyl-CoA reductase [Bacillus atrophaeus]MCY8817142.1 acryloyl-CoA reductase [Bacillus atrophaeus]MCY8916611.1 acryloyl-CoA reductase [Bacillus atrophaeus]MCY8925764.1 acryloyl-CoA reductase [Bacillus atrophaeus]MCY9133519.1 acryloyl-CoA reductase [Bacillus atrophaeus]